MQLPPDAAARIAERGAAIPFAALRRAAAALSESYRASGNARASALPVEERVAAYLVTRMPATYAAAHAAMSETRRRLGGAAVESLLDVGAGAGAAALAAREVFPAIRRLTAIEPDGVLSGVGRELLPAAAWQPRDLRDASPLPVHDLVSAAYALGEVAPVEALAAALRLWQAARVALILIEPGSPAGFSLVRDIRALLLEAGAHMLAPCPAAGPCPMREPDWCHFGSRLERSSLHRRLKDAALPYEDEKFSYVALGRSPVALPAARIVRRPRHAPGLIALEVCRGECVAALPVAKRDREAFRAARKACWGGVWPPDPREP